MSGVGRLTAADVDGAYAAAQRVVDVHRALVGFVRPGQTLAQIDAFVAKQLDTLGAKSCFIGYRQGREPPFPSHSCLSVNDCVVHGTAGYLLRPLKAGDLLKIDIGVRYRGWIGDAGWTYSLGTPDPVIRKLMNAGRESLKRGIAALQPGKPLSVWADAVEDCVEREFGFKLVNGLGGHGYGYETIGTLNPRVVMSLHTAPFVSNRRSKSFREWPDGVLPLAPGMTLALEPMIAIGTGDTQPTKGQWPVLTADGSCSSHHEHDVLITENGPRILTEGLDELPDELPT